MPRFLDKRSPTALPVLTGTSAVARIARPPVQIKTISPALCWIAGPTARSPSLRTVVLRKRSCRLLVLHAAKQKQASQPALGYADHDEAERRPAHEATLRMLDWQQVCNDIASFASTTQGRAFVRQLGVPTSEAEAAQRCAETAAADVLEGELAVDLDFGGIPTTQAREAVQRLSKGGLLSGAQLVALAGLLRGAARLQRAVAGAVGSEAAVGGGAAQLAVLVGPLKSLPTHGGLVDAISVACEDDGRVKDSASDQLRAARQKLRGIEGRIRSLLKAYPGEVTEVGGRICVAVAAGDNPGMPKSVLLGSTAGGGVLYLEPPAALPLNNQLGAARGEAAGAEEAALWVLTGRCADADEDLKRALDVVVWLDGIVARSRYGRWLGGCLPETVPWPRSGKARGGKGRRGEAGGEADAGSDGGDGQSGADGSGGGMMEADQQLLFRVRQLRHPLLLAQHLRHVEATRKAAGSSASGSISRRLSNRKQQLQPAASAQGGGDDEQADGGEASSVLREGPKPVDVCIGPATRAVVITGPNTGGKTATLKAFGLALLMARAGVPVPCLAPLRLPPVSGVLADIGDEQSLSANLSTFSGHLRRIQALRLESDGRSVVLLDEVGTGTDPEEGSALGVALLRRLAAGGPGGAGLVLATTHHSALTALKYEDGRFENASVEFDEVALAPTYRLLWGVPGRSNALNIAARLGLEAGVVDAARARLGAEQAVVDSSIQELEAARRSYEADEAAVLRLQAQMGARRAEVEEARRRVLQQRSALELQEAEVILAATKDMRLRIGATARRQRAAAAAAEAEQLQQRQREEQDEAQLAREAAGWVPRVGDYVMLTRLQARAKVVSVKAGGQLVLQVGKMQVKAAAAEVQAA